jgi:hypothetical protein
VAGRSRTCHAPRFRRALYRLSYGHTRWARLESNQRPLVCKTSALRRLSYSPAMKRWEEGLASLNRCGALLERLPEPSVARQHACRPPSWTAREMPSPLSDAGCTLRPTLRFSVSRSSVTPLGRPSTTQSSVPLRPPPARGRSTQRHEAEPCFPSRSPTLRPWIAWRRPTWRGFGARAS